MNPQFLIDSIVRQTTVLIARLSTMEGVRSPLSHVANEVFVGLVRELESQGVGKKVIADMFGLALRSYRQKVQRLGESETTRGVSLWTAIHDYLAARPSVTRAELLERFKRDEESSVRGILNDLVQSGLVLVSGRGEGAQYRVASADELADLGAAGTTTSEDALTALVWLHIYRDGPLSKDDLGRLVSLGSEMLDSALSSLLRSGRIRETREGGSLLYAADQCLIPIGEAAGWEAAVADHHRTVLNAIASKIASGSRTSTKQDEVGGTTLTFDLWPGHPHEEEVRKLLATARAQVIPLWDKVTAFNAENPRPNAYQVNFYCGQYVLSEEDET